MNFAPSFANVIPLRVKRPHRELTRARLHQIGISGLKADLILSLGSLERRFLSRAQRDHLAGTADYCFSAKERRLACMSQKLAAKYRSEAQSERNSGAARKWKHWTKENLQFAATREHEARRLGFRLP